MDIIYYLTCQTSVSHKVHDLVIIQNQRLLSSICVFNHQCDVVQRWRTRFCLPVTLVGDLSVCCCLIIKPTEVLWCRSSFTSVMAQCHRPCVSMLLTDRPRLQSSTTSWGVPTSDEPERRFCDFVSAPENFHSETSLVCYLCYFHLSDTDLIDSRAPAVVQLSAASYSPNDSNQLGPCEWFQPPNKGNSGMIL